jgi:hypothetical protein
MTEIYAGEDARSAADMHRKMDAEIAETIRINAQSRVWPWFPLLIAVIGNAGLTGIVVAVVVALTR